MTVKKKSGAETEAELRAQIDKEFTHWDDLAEHGNPGDGYPDGVNMNLVRNHIIYHRRQLAEIAAKPVQLTMFDEGVDFGERPLPPVVPDGYMAPHPKVKDRPLPRYWEKDRLVYGWKPGTPLEAGSI